MAYILIVSYLEIPIFGKAYLRVMQPGWRGPNVNYALL